MEDELVCDYDSTWDSESDGDDLGTENTIRRACPDKNKRAKAGFWSNSSSRNLRAAKDMQNYRHGYPNIVEEDCTEDKMPNLKFYLNEIKSSPDDVSIDTIHNYWKSDYKRLERVHSYIQWLFPLREPGVNYLATELTKKEIETFCESKEAKIRLVDSYELMLGFYGILLTDRDTGDVKRAENWRERFANLERNMHNNLRITRILKSLGELGFEHYQAPLVRFFLEETLVKKNLSSVKRSVLDYFVFAVRDKYKRRELITFAFQHFEPKDKFVWCPRRIQKRLRKKAEAKRPDSPSRNKRDDETTRCEGSSVDPEPRRNEGSSVDPEPIKMESSVDPSPLNNGNHHNDNGASEKENRNKPIENSASSSNQETLQVKDADADKEPKNVPASPKESGKHTLKSSPCPERAGKLLRTKKDTAVGISDRRKSSEDTFSTSPPQTLTDPNTKDGEKTNSVDTDEPMDAESSGAAS